MRQLMKKTMALLIAVMMIGTMIPAAAFASSGSDAASTSQTADSASASDSTAVSSAADSAQTSSSDTAVSSTADSASSDTSSESTDTPSIFTQLLQAIGLASTETEEATVGAGDTETIYLANRIYDGTDQWATSEVLFVVWFSELEGGTATWVPMVKTDKTDGKGAYVYSADIPSTWQRIYFAADTTSGTTPASTKITADIRKDTANNLYTVWANSNSNKWQELSMSSGNTFMASSSTYNVGDYQQRGVALETVTFETLTVSPESASLLTGSTQQLTAEITGITGGVTWTSSDETVATVDADGLVTAVSPGTATITASGGSLTDTSEITVDDFLINPSLLKLTVGETGSLTIAAGSTAYDSIEWSSDNESIATVAADSSDPKTATVSGVANGTATITANIIQDGRIIATLTAKVGVGNTNVTIYFDARLSKYDYAGDSVGSNQPMPGSAGLYLYGKDTSGNWVEIGAFTNAGDTAYPDTYKVDLGTSETPPYTAFRINAYHNSGAGTQANGTADFTYDEIKDLANPCFYADDGDTVMYVGGTRGGYWGEAFALRDAESAKGTTIVEVPTETFSTPENTIYLNSTLYDYYSDYELNGYNRKDYPLDEVNSGAARTYATFRQLDMSLSEYYEAANVPVPLYTGHFQPSIWANPFSTIAGGLGLWKWNGDTGSTDYKNFISTNNSTLDANGNGGDTNRLYDMAAWGLVASDASSGLKTASGTLLPYFQRSFLEGDNDKKTVLGKVYDNVKFPFTRIDRDGDGVMYYSFDSGYISSNKGIYAGNQSGTIAYYQQAQDSYGTETTQTVKLRYDEEADTYWLKKLTSSDSDERLGSKNTDATGTDTKDGVSNQYGYFPFSAPGDTVGTRSLKHDYGFGTKLEFDFTVPTTDGQPGMVKDKNGNLVPVTFNFSGDDDVWVFIDGKLALDLGGDHGRTSGAINFSQNSTYTYKYTQKKTGYSDLFAREGTVPAQGAYVSDVKNSATSSGFAYTTVDGISRNEETTSLSSIMSSIYTGTHKLTVYYMERGQWESNMKLQFNFEPLRNLQVKKVFKNGTKTMTTGLPDQVYIALKRYSTSQTEADVAYFDLDPDTAGDQYYVTLNAANNWQLTLEGLKDYVDYWNDQTTKYRYVAYEAQQNADGSIKLSNGEPVLADSTITLDGQDYTVDATQDDGGVGLTVTNTKSPTISLSIGKNWTDMEKAGEETVAVPDTLKVKVQRKTADQTEWSDVAVSGSDADGWYTLTSAQSFAKTFTGLAKYADAADTQPYSYRIIEEGEDVSAISGDGTTAVISGITYTVNTADSVYEGTTTDETAASVALENTPQRTEVSVTKQWFGPDGVTAQDAAKIPDEVYVKLTRTEDGSTESQDVTGVDGMDANGLITLLKSESWTKTISGLLTANPGTGKSYTYRFVEVHADGSALTDSSVTFTLNGTDVSYTANGGDVTDGEALINNIEQGNTSLALTKTAADKTQGESGYLQEGVEFRLQKYDTDGTTLLENFDQTAVSGTDGIVSWTGLSDGKYRISEIKAVSGYNLLEKPIIVIVNRVKDPSIADGAEYSVTTEENGVIVGDPQIDGDLISFTIQNTPGASLPITGGPGRTLLVLAGLACIMAFLLYYKTKVRRRAVKARR